MRDPDDRESIQLAYATLWEDVQRYRNFLKSDTLEEGSRVVLHMLLKQAEDRLAELEGRVKPGWSKVQPRDQRQRSNQDRQPAQQLRRPQSH